MAIFIYTMNYADLVNTLKTLNIKKKGNRPKVNPNKFYPSQLELQTKELLAEELEEYGERLLKAAKNGGVSAVYGIPGAVPKGFDKLVEKIAYNVSNFQVRAFANFSELMIGERFFPTQESKEEIVGTWRDNFVNLCKSTNEEMRKKVAGSVSDAVLEGRNIREVSQSIENMCSDFTRNKAELIATTEIGKLNTAIARNQSESVGIKYYEWGAAMDGRTRQSHALMDGKICKWGEDTKYYEWEVNPKTGKRELKEKERPKGAYIGAPGTDFRCRCVALPYLPEYEDDYEEQRAKGPIVGVTQERPVKVKPSMQTLELERKLSLSKRADERHAARTEEQRQEIIAKWEERQRKLRLKEAAELRHATRNAEKILAERQKRIEIRNKARELAKSMEGIYGIDTQKLQEAIVTGKVEIIKKEMKPIEKAKKEIEALGNSIDNPMDAAKKYGFLRTINTVEAAKKTINSWGNISLKDKKAKLEMEIQWVEQKKKYATWELSRDIYKKELGKVESEIKWNELTDKMNLLNNVLNSQQNKDAKFTKLMKDVDKASKGDKFSASDYEKFKKAVEKAEKKAADFSTEGATFDISKDYTAERKNKALWAKDVKTADNELRSVAGKVWIAATNEEKDAVCGYTRSYSNINEPLRGITYVGSTSKKREGLTRIPLITKYIGKSAIKRDMWVQRFDDAMSLKKFGRSLSRYADARDIYNTMRSLIGKEGTEGGFTSAGVSKGKGLDSRPIIYNIYMPKGVKAAYLEPISSYGNGAGRNWDGKSKQSSYGTEAEILIQRGSKWRITDVKFGKYDGKERCFIDVEIIEQKPLPFPYKNGFPY